MAKILILSLVFGPDTVSTANMMTDVAHGLQARGHSVTVLTSMPHYNPSQGVLNNPKYRAKLPKLFTESNEDGVRVLRAYMPLKRQRIWLRALDYAWFHTLTALIALLRVGHQDIIFVPSPPITLGISGFVLAVLLRAKLIYDVRELWPDVPIRMGLIKNKLLIRLVYGLEGLVYKKSAAITSIARHFNNNLANRGVPEEKLHFTPNFVDIKWLTPLPKSNSFAVEYGLEDQFVVLYAGNIGLTQGLEILTDVGKALGQYQDIKVVVIGDGAGRGKLEQAVKHAMLNNIVVLPFQPYERVPETYATANVCISPMLFGFSYDTVPSKIYTAMAAARPVIAACEQDTESAQLLNDSRAGIVVSPESAPEIIEAILRLYRSPEMAQQMGERARDWIVEHYSKDAVIATYDAVIRQVAHDAMRPPSPTLGSVT